MLARQARAGCAEQNFLLSSLDPSIFRTFCPRVGDTLLFENGYFDASFALGIWYI